MKIFNSLHAGKFFMIFCQLLIFFSKVTFFELILSGTISECQTVQIKIRTDILSVLIWVKTACRDYQTANVPDSNKKRVKFLMRPNKKSVFQVTGLKHTHNLIFFSGNKI